MISFIIFILVFVLFLCFIIFNLGNASDVSLGFRTFSDIPVFLTALFSFALGMLFTFPLLITVGRKRRQKRRAARAAQAENSQGDGLQSETPQMSEQQMSDKKLSPPKKKLFGNKKPKKAEVSEEGKSSSDTGPYGID